MIRRGAALIALLLFASCATKGGAPIPARPHVLPLATSEDLGDIEFSSLCWWGDQLLLLPQYPVSRGLGVYVLHRDSIGRAVEQLEQGRPVTPLQPRLVRADAEGIPARIEAYDGLEALAIRDGRCYALAEFGEDEERWGSWLVAGSVEREEAGLHFERLADTAIYGPQVRANYTHEAVVLTESEVWVLCELNGRSVIDRPLMARFTRDLEELPPLRMPRLEYRISDATDVDADGRFWVLNLFWPPDASIVQPEVNAGPVEWIVPLRVVGDEVVRDRARPTLDLRAGGDHAMHNWEGVARWGEDGFLLVTDSYPENLLAYVAIPE